MYLRLQRGKNGKGNSIVFIAQCNQSWMEIACPSKNALMVLKIVGWFKIMC
jgi:hypothetical protein